LNHDATVRSVNETHVDILEVRDNG